ncbi:hypothetical protein [Nocardia sp. NPDC051832]|uniref:hypothetical protein n=1 Tax=Nocardia sp. NPDC051832 TaxID=3155673 RepID=UPI00341B754C
MSNHNEHNSAIARKLEAVAAMIERSSLGTEEARDLRALTTIVRSRRVVARSDDLERGTTDSLERISTSPPTVASAGLGRTGVMRAELSGDSGSVQETGWLMTSDVTPESAYRDASAGCWRLTWLPERRLTREQARAGMELDEILSDIESVHDQTAQARAAELADQLGMLSEQAVIRLSKRVIQRMQDESPTAEHASNHRKERLDQWLG